MRTFFFRRSAALLLTLLIGSVVIYSALYLAPGDPSA